MKLIVVTASPRSSDYGVDKPIKNALLINCENRQTQTEARVSRLRMPRRFGRE